MAAKKYDESMPGRVFKLALLGLADKDLAVAFGVSAWTISEWKTNYPEFEEALHKGRIHANAEVAHAMFKRATGYDYYQQEVKVLRSKDGEKAVTVEVRKHVIPNVTAGIFWLKNKSRNDLKISGNWQDVYKTEHSGPNGGPIELTEKTDLSGLNAKELAALASAGLKISGNIKELPPSSDIIDAEFVDDEPDGSNGTSNN